MSPLIVCLDRQTLPMALPELQQPHRWQDWADTEPEQVVERLQGATVAVSNKVALTASQLQQLPDLRLIAVSATGYNIIDLEACRASGIHVCNVPAYSTDAVAEHTLMLMLMLRHRIGEYQQHAQTWPDSRMFCVFGSPILELRGATLTLIGGGAIGSRVASLAQAFGMRVLRAEHRGAASVRPGYTAFEQALAEADIVSLHCPLNAATRGLIGAAELALLPAHALLINTARGGLVDESALADALRNGRLAGAALDVLSSEPPLADHPLLQLAGPQLILTPHVAWASEPAMRRMASILMANIDAFLGGTLQNQIV